MVWENAEKTGKQDKKYADLQRIVSRNNEGDEMKNFIF